MPSKEFLLDIAEIAVANDPDCSHVAWDAKETFARLLDSSVWNTNGFTRETGTLLQNYIVFVGTYKFQLPGGSISDYVSNAIIDTMEEAGLNIVSIEPDIKKELIESITGKALYPEREIDELSNAGWL